MKYRTLEFIGSLILGAVAIGMASQAKAADVEECLAYAKFAQTVDQSFDDGYTLGSVVSGIVQTPVPTDLQRKLINMAITVHEFYLVITPAEAYALTFDVCMRMGAR